MYFFAFGLYQIKRKYMKRIQSWTDHIHMYIWRSWIDLTKGEVDDDDDDGNRGNNSLAYSCISLSLAHKLLFDSSITIKNTHTRAHVVLLPNIFSVFEWFTFPTLTSATYRTHTSLNSFSISTFDSFSFPFFHFMFPSPSISVWCASHTLTHAPHPFGQIAQKWNSHYSFRFTQS